MTPSPFVKHGHLLSKVSTALNNAIDANSCNASVLLEIDWIIDTATVVRPDVSVVRGPPPAGHIENAPDLIVEVLSATTRDRDLTVKRELFEQHAVDWYLIVDPDNDSLQVLRLNADARYEPVELTGHLQVSLCQTYSLNVRLDRLFG